MSYSDDDLPPFNPEYDGSANPPVDVAPKFHETNIDDELPSYDDASKGINLEKKATNPDLEAPPMPKSSEELQQSLSYHKENLFTNKGATAWLFFACFFFFVAAVTLFLWIVLPFVVTILAAIFVFTMVLIPVAIILYLCLILFLILGFFVFWIAIALGIVCLIMALILLLLKGRDKNNAKHTTNQV